MSLTCLTAGMQADYRQTARAQKTNVPKDRQGGQTVFLNEIGKTLTRLVSRTAAPRTLHSAVLAAVMIM
ncbi:hypothetical protein GCM10020370_01980 [Paenibacillus hodogayensis]